MPQFVLFLIALAVLIVPFVVGGVVASRLRMADHGWKIGLSLFALVSGAVITYFGWPPKLGIDLSGGVILVYQVDPKEVAAGKEIRMEQLIGAVSRRVNPGGVREVTIREYGQNQVEIIIPEADTEEVERIERKISSIGALQFRILANRRDHEDLIAEAEGSSARELRRSDGTLDAWWVPIDGKEVEYFRNDPEILTRPSPANRDQLEVLVVEDEYNVNGQYLERSAADIDRTNRPCVNFNLNAQGANLFGQLTGDNLPDRTSGFTRKLGIILDGYLQSAPAIQSAIFDNGQITGNFTRERVDEIVGVLNAGSLPNALEKEPISRLLTGPTLGADTIRKGELAVGISMALVIVFMLFYYRFAGIVACIALIMNLVITLAAMITIKAAFTLPGLAGLVLTVGMAVDANVLIYERMREEIQRGAALRMAIRNGFDRAFSAIFDSNLTTLITAVVLYAIGTDQVKGFAVTLFLGIALSMFTAIFVARVIFEVAEKARWIDTLKMMSMIRTPNVDFVRMTPVWIGVSVVVIGIGLVGVLARGRSLMDIDFTGGASVQVQFRDDQPQQIADVRRAVESKLADVAVSDIRLTGEDEGRRFLVNTSQRDLQAVERELAELFGDRLVRNQLTFGELAQIEPKAAKNDAEGDAAPAAQPASGDQGRALPGTWRRDPLPRDNEIAQAEAPPSATEAPQSIAAPAATEPAQATEPSATADTPQATEAPQATEPVQPTDSPATSASPAGASAPASVPASAPAAAPASGAGPVGDAPEVKDVFEGGSKTDLNLGQPMDHDSLVERLQGVLPGVQIALANPEYNAGNRKAHKAWEARFAAPADQVRPALEKLDAQLRSEPYFPSSSVIGGAVAKSTQSQAITAMIASIILMIVYLWVRFQKVVFGVAAAIALVHDVLVTLGAVALSYYLAPYLGIVLVDPFKINLPIVAAFLTIVGYSVNDTIVTFDRLREIRGKSTRITPEMINQSINQTLSRTILTSLTVLLVVVTLYAFGGQGIHGFAFAMLIGCIAGVYSTVFIAAPIVLWMLNRDEVAPGTSGSASKPVGRAAPSNVA